MKPFKINRNSWHYKLNNHFFNEYGDWGMEQYWERRHANFCAYWRATVLRLFFASLLALFVLSVIALMVNAAITDPVGCSIAVGIVISLVVLGIAVVVLSDYLKSRKSKAKPSDKPESLVAQRYRAYKSKICPSVEFK
jgi:hypothetical protein